MVDMVTLVPASIMHLPHLLLLLSMSLPIIHLPLTTRRSRTLITTSTECTTTTTGQTSMLAKLLMALGGWRDPTLSSFQTDAHNMSSTMRTTTVVSWPKSPMKELPISQSTILILATVMVAMGLRVNSNLVMVPI